jgi:putative transcriptional regulator
MPKKLPSAKSSKNTKAPSGDRLSAAARRIVAGLREGVAHNRGEIALPTRYYIPADIDVAAIRRKIGLSQADFANRFGFSPRSLQDWEQGRRQPEGAVRAYLLVIERVPDVVAGVLAARVA